MPDAGPFTGPPTNDWLDSPEYKLYLRGAGAGRGGPGGQRPGSGGGFAAFGGGANTLSGGSALGGPGWMRRTPYESMGMVPTQAQTMTGLRQNMGPMTSSAAAPQGLTPEQEQSIAHYPAVIRDAMRKALIAKLQSQGGANASNNNNQPLNWQQAGNNTDPGWAGTFWRTLAPFGMGGTFGPTGSADVQAAIEAQGNRLAGGAYNRAQKQSQLLGLDPAAAASYSMEAGLRGQTDTANALQQAQLAQMMQAQQWAQNILGTYLGQNTGAGATDSINRYRMDQQGGGGSGWGQLLGGLGGSVLGGWLSPGGWWGKKN